MNRTRSTYRRKSTVPLRQLSLGLLLLCSFTSWIGFDFQRADATVSSVYLLESKELIAANNTDTLRVRAGLRKTDPSDKNDSETETDPIWPLLPADLPEFFAPSSTNHNQLLAGFIRGTDKYLLKAPRAPPLA